MGRQGFAKGSGHPRWNNGKIVSSQGYAKIRVGNHPLADPNGYAYEHLVVWAAAGRDLPLAGETLHHVNGDKGDNRIENLELLSRSDHNRHHNTGRARDASGRFLPRPPAKP